MILPLQDEREAVSWRIETLSDLNAIHRHAADWQALELECSDPYAAFQSYAWCEAWVASFCTPSAGRETGAANETEQAMEGPRQPVVQLIYQNELLIGILPLMMTRHRGARVLSMLGEPHSQIASVLMRKNVDCYDGLRLSLEMAQEACRCDLVSIGPLPENNVLLDIFDSQHLTNDPAIEMSLVSWPKIWQVSDYVAQLSKNRRKDFNRKLRMLQQMGTPRHQHFYAGDEKFDALVRWSVEQKIKWLQCKGIYSHGLTHEGLDDFLSKVRGQKGGFELEVEALFLGDKVIASNINLVGKGVRQCYLSAYDPQFEIVSVGTLLHQYSIRSAIEDGYGGMNYLGHPTLFKSMWAKEKIQLLRYQKAHTSRGRIWLSLWLQTVRPAVKASLTRLRFLAGLPVVGPVFGRILSTHVQGS